MPHRNYFYNDYDNSNDKQRFFNNNMKQKRCDRQKSDTPLITMKYTLYKSNFFTDKSEF